MKKIQKSLLVAASLAHITVARADDAASTNPDSSLKIKPSLEMGAGYNISGGNNSHTSFGPANIGKREDGGELEDGNTKMFVYGLKKAELAIEKTCGSGDGAVTLSVKTKLKDGNLTLKDIHTTFKNFTLGKTRSPFSGGKLASGEVPQIGYQYNFNSTCSCALAIEKPKSFKVSCDNQGDINPIVHIPAASTNLKWEKEGLVKVHLGVTARFLEYKAKKNNVVSQNVASQYDNKRSFAYGVNLATELDVIAEKTTVALEGIFGKGMGSCMADLRSLKKEPKVAYVKDESKREIEARMAWGARVGLAHKWTPKLSSDVAYRLMSTIDKEDNKEIEDKMYQQGHYVSADLYYHPTKQVKVGVGYLLAMRKGKNETKNIKAQRAEVAVCFKL